MLSDKDIERYTHDIVAWAEEQYNLIETGQPIRLAEHQKRILREMTRRDDNGRFLYQTLIYSAPKKSGKTEIAALYTLWTAVFIAEPFGEIYVCANDLEQSQGRVFQAVTKALRANNIYNADITAREMNFSTGTKIVALANDYAGAAGSNPNLTVWSELWGYTSENSRRLWEELTPVPTRKNSIRLIETYAGFSSESELLLSLYQRGLEGERICEDLPAYRSGRVLMYWDHEARMPWQTEEYYEEQRRQLRPNQYIRLHENRFVSSESQFINYEKWLACERSDLHPFPSHRLSVVIGCDLATRRDGAALCAVTRLPGNRLRVVAHRFWVPSKENEINLSEVENELREWCRKYRVHCIFYDPFQAELLASRLRNTLGKSRVKAFPQTPSNLEMAANELYSAIEDRRLEVYSSDEFRSQIRHVVAIETTRIGWKIAKDKQSSRVDLIAALSFACVAAVEMPTLNQQFGIGGIHCIRMSQNRPVVSCPIGGGRVYDPICHHCDALLGFFDSTVERIVESGCRRSTPIESVAEFVRRRPDASEGIHIASGGPPLANKPRHNFKYPKIQRG